MNEPINMVKVRDSVGDAIYGVSEREQSFNTHYTRLYFAVDSYMRRILHQALRED